MYYHPPSLSYSVNRYPSISSKIKMQPFQLTLSNNGTVTGRHSIPPPPSQPPPQPQPKPLIVALHGGFYNSTYFDATPPYSAQPTSTRLNVPFVAIDRPCYGGTSSILPLPPGSDFPQETGTWLHRLILPRLWREFGVPNGCVCIVLLCHSLGVTGGVVAAALHAESVVARSQHDGQGQDQGEYPLGGLIASGMGNTSTTQQTILTVFEPVGVDHIRFPIPAKNATMFNKPGTVPAEVLAHSERLNSPLPTIEATRFDQAWMAVWREKWAGKVTVPVRVALVQDDPYFLGTEDEVDKCVAAFGGSQKVEGRLMRDEPHCIELSWWAPEWYASCFGFGVECATLFLEHTSE